MTSVAPPISNRRRYLSPCFEILPSFCLPRRVLSRHEADPGGEVAAGFEGARIGDGRCDRGRPDHAHARDFFEALARLTRTVLRVNAALESADLVLQCCEL